MLVEKAVAAVQWVAQAKATVVWVMAKAEAVERLVGSSEAAERGSAGAAWGLAKFFEAGSVGLPKDLARAKEWYEKVASATVRDLDRGSIHAAAESARKLSA